MSKLEERQCFDYIADCVLNNKKEVVFNNAVKDRMKYYLAHAHHNENNSVFPDFIFDEGCIEHFNVTSSKEDKKGSSFISKRKQDENHNNELLKKDLNTVSKESFSNSSFKTLCYKNEYNDFSYEWFLTSLEKNIKKHIQSLSKSEYMNKVVIFLIEQKTGRMFIDENRSSRYDPVVFYTLYTDKKALNIIKKTATNVDYIIYCVADAIEIIDLSKIDNLINNAKEYQKVSGGRLITDSIVTIFHI